MRYKSLRSEILAIFFVVILIFHFGFIVKASHPDEHGLTIHTDIESELFFHSLEVKEVEFILENHRNQSHNVSLEFLGPEGYNSEFSAWSISLNTPTNFELNSSSSKTVTLRIRAPLNLDGAQTTGLRLYLNNTDSESESVQISIWLSYRGEIFRLSEMSNTKFALLTTFTILIPGLLIAKNYRSLKLKNK